jgi:type 1 glutamine amidotransferase
MSEPGYQRVHLITGGFPVGSLAGHDMDFVRQHLLGLLQEIPSIRTTVANDYQDIERWLPGTDLLMTYVAGPFATDAQAEFIDGWLREGGHWLALHGSAGGKAVKIDTPQGRRKQMVKAKHHETIGSFFINHPPIRRFTVQVAPESHPLTRGIPDSFEATDELYLIELQAPDDTQILLTTELETDTSPPGFGFVYDEDTSLLADGRTRVLGYEMKVGQGSVAYIALGHCHHPQSNTQPVVDASVVASGEPPNPFRGSWAEGPLTTMLRNAIQWGTDTAGSN